MNASLTALRAQVNERHQALLAAAERARLAKRLTLRTPTYGRRQARRPNRTVALHVVR